MKQGGQAMPNSESNAKMGRRQLRLMTVGLITCAILVGAAAAQTVPWSAEREFGPQRIDGPSEHYQIGYLTWNQGKPGIAWDPAAPTEDKGTSTDTVGGATQKAHAYVGWVARTNTGSDEVAGQKMIPFDIFESNPLSRTLHVNVSRMIQLDLFFVGNCPAVSIELYMGTTLMAGAMHGQRGGSWGTVPKAPSSYCVSALTMSRMHSEFDVLPKNARLTLKVLHHDQNGAVEYSLKDPFHSQLRIPFYSPEEVAFRTNSGSADLEAGGAQPERFPPIAQTPPRSEWILLLLAASSWVGRRSPQDRRGLLVVALVLALPVFSGCIGGSDAGGSVENQTSPTPSGLANVTELRDLEGHDGLADEGLGAVIGTIQNDLAAPLVGAYVFLVGTEHSSSTDGQGQFALKNVLPGTYVLRADRDGYHSLETNVTAKPDGITRIEVTLLPLEMKATDFRPHRHDDWGGKDSLTLMDDVVQVAPDGTPYTMCTHSWREFVAASVGGSVIPGAYSDPNFCRYDFSLPASSAGKPPMIIPGTRDVEVVVTWEWEANRVDRVGVGIIANNDVNATYFYPRKSGVPTHIRTNWEMADVGHQLFTTWSFFLYVPTNGGGVGGQNGDPQGRGLVIRPAVQPMTKPFHVKITISKGVLGLEPAHQDRWGPNLTLPIYTNATNSYYPCSRVCNGYPWVPWARTQSKNLIPPETRWLEISLTLDKPTPGWEWLLGYKSANVPPPPNPSFPNNLVSYYTPPAYKPLSFVKENETKQKAVLVLSDGEADPFYARKTNWDFAFKPDKDGAPGLGYDALYYDSTSPYRTLSPYRLFTLDIVAHRDPPPT